MKNSILGVATLFLFSSGCSSEAVNHAESHQPANGVRLGEIITSADQANFCEGVGPGGACLVSWERAAAYCQRHDSHLPSAREYVRYLTQFGVRLLTVEEFNGTQGVAELRPQDIGGLPRKDGFYKVACQPNPDGSSDTFYMNDFHYTRPPGLPGNHLIWTATSPPGHDEAAHVVYDQWGGGGGIPREHIKSAANAFRCVPDL